MPAWLGRFIGRQTHAHPHPFVIGLLNGLMIACGPLQAMYVMAAGTGSAVEGAKMLFAFGIGTLPVLLSFGVLTTLISGALTHRLLTASGAILIILGAVMINRGLILTGTGLPVTWSCRQGIRATRFLHTLAEELHERFNINHPTVQIETDPNLACLLTPDEVV